MKVLRLSFKNLNSLAGVWEIDFTHPDYVSSGIFAITGPTGAGKTTILDAICLALYGQTPRLDRITQSDNEIMSRQTGECFAEIEFETAKGRFRCHWGQHRSRRLADGQLQSPRHEIVEAESGVILESKLKAVAIKVEEVTGMDFDRFTRSMLLAQGGFAAFLQAGPDQRAPILEQITGTEIYSRISIKVHERTSEERRKLAELRSELDGILLLTTEEEQALLGELVEQKAQETTLSSEIQNIREARSWRERIVTLEQELRQLEHERLAFATEKSLAAPGLEELALAGRALKIAGEHAHLKAVRTQQQLEESQLKNSEERLPQMQLVWQAASDRLEQARQALDQAGAEQVRGAGLIRAVRELDIKLGELSSSLQALGEDAEKTRQQGLGYRLAINACDARLSKTATEMGLVALQLEQHQSDAGLVEALTGIGQQLKNVIELDRQAQVNRDKLSRQANLIKTARERLDQAEVIWKSALQAAAGAEEQLAMFSNAREELLQGRELPVLRQQSETIAARISRLSALGEAAGRIEQARQRLADLTLRISALEQQRQGLLMQGDQLAGEQTLRAQLSAQLQDKVILLGRVRDLEEERARLVDGLPCPLCGSVEHPYAVGNLPQLDLLQHELEQSQDDLKRVAAQLVDNRLEQVAAGKDLEQARQEQADLLERQKSDDAFCRAGFVELGLDSAVANWPDLVRLESEACQAALLNLRDAIQQMEQSERSEQAARLEFHRLKDALSLQEKTRITAAADHESTLRELKRLQEESLVLQEQLAFALTDVQRVVKPFGCSSIVPDRADLILEDLSARRTAWLSWMQAREHLEKGLSGVAAEKETQQALLAEAERVLADKGQLLLEKTAKRAGLLDQRLELYGERDPDREERLLAETLQQTGQHCDQAQLALNQMQAELDTLNQQVQRLREQLSQRAGQLSDLEPVLLHRLNEAGFADEAAFLQVCLPTERFDELTQLAETLKNRETTLQTRQQDRCQALELELERNLTDKPLDQICEESEIVAGRLGDLQKAIGALDQKLSQDAEQRQRHSSRLQEIDAAKLECERWERLHLLIGSGDGKKFRNFAQGLTFELMVAHANRQLQKMSDRYLLVRDRSEPLELNVIDNYRAGDIRSTRNLSGGESFIASLALSLGLSNMASRNVRVDSLFLDEGFGTLDEDALETALETLSALQQDGKLIGIISHVPALKERIGIQIQVEAGSAGRSSLSGPGCSRK